MKDEPVRIVGQGLAGTLLGWACEQQGIAFQVIDRGHAKAASRVGAGLISPLTGLRLVPTWRFAQWNETVRQAYGFLEQELQCSLLRSLRLRRIFRDAAERERMEARLGVPEVATWVESADTEGIWMRGAFQIDTALLISRMRSRWLGKGWLQAGEAGGTSKRDLRRTIWCTGADVRDRLPKVARWELSRGELLTGRMGGLEPDVVLNDGKWLLPITDDRVRIGATFERDNLERAPGEVGRGELREAARRLGGGELTEVVSDSGLRVNVPDRRPVVGWLDPERRIGVLGGLAAKGTLWAPVLAMQWAEDGLQGGGIDPETRADRFLARCN